VTGSDKEPQWINCDVRSFDANVLGTFDVVMTDPPWDIHMDLPYGTMTDTEMHGMKTLMQECQPEVGIVFMWVTGRAMELARRLFATWGYRQVDEVIWLKTNQLQRVIRTGRTGHWLNHSKEHCLIGVKGDLSTWDRPVNMNVDCDVLVAEVRETSRKPDEIYSIIERLCPGGRKLEIFGRKHNINYGWTTMGNQLPPTRLMEAEMVERYNRRYPNNPYIHPADAPPIPGLDESHACYQRPEPEAVKQIPSSSGTGSRGAPPKGAKAGIAPTAAKRGSAAASART